MLITSVLAVATVSLGASMLGLLIAGARWKQARLHHSLTYAVVVLMPAYALAEYLWRLPRLHLWTGLGVVTAAILITSLTRRDWNPPAQSFLGTLTLACLAFIAFGAQFTLSGKLAVISLIGSVLLMSLEAFAFLLLLISTHEVLDVVGRVRWHRRTMASETIALSPFISIHVATHNEPPELVLETLRSLRALRYDSYEVIVLDNNTDDPALWLPLQRYCEEVGFRFVHLENWPGFKSGALNHALKILDDRTEIVAVVDSDFVVQADFLERTVGYFADPEVAIVQTAQDFRTDNDTPYLRRLALTYRSFDEVTMPSRNERNAIIFAGTMGLLRRDALVKAGGWAEWCVTEDAELSLRMLARGYQSIYVERSFGSGVMPLTFSALKRQRFRWCFGGIQILRRHWRLLVTGRGTAPDGAPLSLTRGQRYEYLSAALQWFQPLVTLIFSALLLLAATLRLVSLPFELRPLVGLFVAVPILLLISGIGKAIWGLRARLRVSWVEAVSVVGIWLSLSWAVALGCLQALSGRDAPFFCTPKFKEHQNLKQALTATKFETPFAAALTLATIAFLARSRSSAETAFLSGLAAWGALVFWCAPITAFAASRTDLVSAVLRKRRRLEGIRGRTAVYARPLALGLGLSGAAIALIALIGGTSALAPKGPGLEEIFTLPERPLPGSENGADQGGEPDDQASGLHAEDGSISEEGATTQVASENPATDLPVGSIEQPLPQTTPPTAQPTAPPAAEPTPPASEPAPAADPTQKPDTQPTPQPRPSPSHSTGQGAGGSP